MRVTKFLIIVILLLVIIALAGFMYFKVSALNPGSNFFNDNLRYRFARYPSARQALGLHFDGDARADYLGDKYRNITIKIISMDGLAISDETARAFAKKVEITTGKKTDYLFYPGIQYKPQMSMEELQKHLANNGFSSPAQGAIIYVFIVSQKENDNVILGSTLLENGIVLFRNSLANDMRKDDQENIDAHSASLLLHEFGHQIGLRHNPIEGCLMNENTDFSTDGKLLEKIDDFCEYEKSQIERMVM